MNSSCSPNRVRIAAVGLMFVATSIFPFTCGILPGAFAQTGLPGRGVTPGRTVDPVGFSLKGLKLLMPLVPASVVLGDLATENGSRVYPNGDGPCAFDKITAIKEHKEAQADKGGCRKYMYYDEYGGARTQFKFKVMLKFSEDIPDSPGNMLVSEIQLTQFGVLTEADQKAFIDAVKEKYGPPTVVDVNGGGTLIYCSQPVSWSKPRWKGDPPIPSCDGAGLEVKREVETVKVRLWDPRFINRSKKEEQKLIDATRTIAKPVL